MAIAVAEPAVTYKDNADRSVYTSTNTWTPAANDVIVAFITATACTEAAPTLTSLSETWTLQTSATFNSGASTVYCFTTAITGTPTLTTPVFTCTPTTATGCTMSFLTFTGAATSSFVVQTKIKNSTTGSNPTITFASNLNTNNGYGWGVAVPANPAGVTEPGSWTETEDTGHTSPSTGIEVAYRAGGESGATITGTRSSINHGIIGIEIAVVAGAGVGSSSGTGAATGIGASTAASTASSSGVGAATGVGASTAAATAASTGTGAATGIGASIAASPGSSTGTGAATGVGASTAASTAASTGTGTATGIGISTAASVAASSGTGAATGIGSSAAASIGASSGVGAATGIGASTAASVGASAGVGAALGVGLAIDGTIGTAAGNSTVLGVGASRVASVGSSVGTSTASGVGSFTSHPAFDYLTQDYLPREIRLTSTKKKKKRRKQIDRVINPGVIEAIDETTATIDRLVEQGKARSEAERRALVIFSRQEADRKQQHEAELLKAAKAQAIFNAMIEKENQRRIQEEKRIKKEAHMAMVMKRKEMTMRILAALDYI